MGRLLVLLVFTSFLQPACSNPVRTAATLMIVTAGSGVTSLHAEHQRVYSERAAAIRAGLHDGGTIADYDRLIAPVDAAFRARSHDIQTLDSGLYAAAGIVDAVRSGAGRTAYLAAARSVLDLILHSAESLRDGSVLPAVAIPRQVDEVVGQLRLFLGEPNSAVDGA